MNYIRVVARSNGELKLDDQGNLLNSKVIYNFGELTEIDPVFRDVDYLFITGELKEAIVKNGLSGLKFEKIEAIRNGKNFDDEEFFQIMVDEQVENPDFYIYDGTKLAASSEGVSIIKKIGIGDVKFIGLDEMSDSEKFYAEFEKLYEKGEIGPNKKTTLP